MSLEMENNGVKYDNNEDAALDDGGAICLNVLESERWQMSVKCCRGKHNHSQNG